MSFKSEMAVNVSTTPVAVTSTVAVQRCRCCSSSVRRFIALLWRDKSGARGTSAMDDSDNCKVHRQIASPSSHNCSLFIGPPVLDSYFGIQTLTLVGLLGLPQKVLCCRTLIQNSSYGVSTNFELIYWLRLVGFFKSYNISPRLLYLFDSMWIRN